MKRTRRSRAMGAVVVLLLLALSARAGERKIWMDEFKQDFVPLTGQTTTMLAVQNPSGARVFQWPGEKTSWTGWVSVKLPVGTTIQNVVYYHGGGGANTHCTFYRIKFGKGVDTVAFGSSASASPTVVALAPDGPGKYVIMEDYRYYIAVLIEHPASVKGVKIIYE